MSKAHLREKRGAGEGVVKIWVYFLLFHFDLLRKLSLLPKWSLLACGGNW